MAKRHNHTTQETSKLTVLDTEFIVDFDLREIRQADKPSNVFSFDELKYDNNLEGYRVAFDKQEKKLHTVDDPSIASRHTEQFLIPDLFVLGRMDITHSATPLNGRTHKTTVKEMKKDRISMASQK